MPKKEFNHIKSFLKKNEVVFTKQEKIDFTNTVHANM